MKKRLIFVLTAMILFLVGCSSQKSIETSPTESLTVDETDGTSGYYYKNITAFNDSTDFPASGVGKFDLSKSPMEWITEAFEKYELTAGLGGDNEKTSVTDIDALLNTEISYGTNFEIHFNDESNAVVVCTNFFTPYDDDKKVTVADCLSLGWWKADNFVTINGKDYVEDNVTIEEIVDVFGNPTRTCMVDDLIYYADDFIYYADEAVKDNESLTYSLVWSDGTKYMSSAATDEKNGNHVLSPHLYGNDAFFYYCFGENPDTSNVILSDSGSGSSASSSGEATISNEGIEQIVFPESSGTFTTVTIKSDYRNSYFTMELPSEYTFNTTWGSEYEGYTIAKYASEGHEDDIVYMDTDNDFMAKYDGVQNADDTNTERLARKYPNGVWVEENGLKAYAYEDSHIFVSIDNGDNTNLLVSFYGDVNKYSLEEYAKYILGKVKLIK